MASPFIYTIIIMMKKRNKKQTTKSANRGNSKKQNPPVAGKGKSGKGRGGDKKEIVKTIEGIFRGTGKSYAFLTPLEGGEDYFVPPKGMGKAMNGDRVIAEIKRTTSGKNEANVIKVTEKCTVYVVGRYDVSASGKAVIIPDDGKTCRLFVIEGISDGLKPKKGYKVVGLPTGRDGDLLFGDIIEVLGEPNKKMVDIISVARAYGLTDYFPPEVQAAARSMPFEVLDPESNGREDFRSDTVITIDGVDTKDIDDAVAVVRTKQGYRLSVHIADVSHYVKEGSALDKEAYKRATSVYFPGMVCPMLPPELSNGICSLNPKVDRLTLSCIMDIDHKGNIVKSRIVKGIIKTIKPVDYDTVALILEGDEKARETHADVASMLETAKELALLLNEKRTLRGNIEFNLPESKIILDDDGVCIDVQLYEHKISHMMIEEFMLAANETVAEKFDKMKVPFVYRSHEKPPAEKEQAFIEYLEAIGVNFTGGTPAAYAQFLTAIKDRPESAAISKIALRTMSKAKYTEKDLGHFGLAAQYYCHFTSPIRRYPDLQIHRIISDWLVGGNAATNRYKPIVRDAAVQSSVREQVSETAERKADDVKMAQFMSRHIGEEFDGIVSSVTEFGFFVQLHNGIEGLVRKELIGESEFEPKMFRLKTADRYISIGDAVTVAVLSVTVDKISFEPVSIN